MLLCVTIVRRIIARVAMNRWLPAAALNRAWTLRDAIKMQTNLVGCSDSLAIEIWQATRGDAWLPNCERRTATVCDQNSLRRTKATLLPRNLNIVRDRSGAFFHHKVFTLEGVLFPVAFPIGIAILLQVEVANANGIGSGQESLDTFKRRQSIGFRRLPSLRCSGGWTPSVFFGTKVNRQTSGTSRSTKLILPLTATTGDLLHPANINIRVETRNEQNDWGRTSLTTIWPARPSLHLTRCPVCRQVLEACPGTIHEHP